MTEPEQDQGQCDNNCTTSPSPSPLNAFSLDLDFGRTPTISTNSNNNNNTTATPTKNHMAYTAYPNNQSQYQSYSSYSSLTDWAGGDPLSVIPADCFASPPLIATGGNPYVWPSSFEFSGSGARAKDYGRNRTVGLQHYSEGLEAYHHGHEEMVRKMVPFAYLHPPGSLALSASPLLVMNE
jgi:hypothetical protein